MEIELGKSLPGISGRDFLFAGYCSRLAQTVTDFADASHSESAKSTTTTVLYGIFSSENSYPCTVTNKVPFYGNLPIKREKAAFQAAFPHFIWSIFDFYVLRPPSIPRPYTVRSAGQVPHCIGRSDRRTPFHQYFRSIVFSPPRSDLPILPCSPYQFASFPWTKAFLLL